MATPCKTVARCSTTIIALFRIVQRRGSFEWHFLTHHKAINFRNRIYAFRSTFLSDPNASPDLAQVVTMTKMKVKDKTLFLEYEDDEQDTTGHRQPVLSRSRRLDHAGRVR